MATKDEQLLSEMQDKSYTVDSSTGRVVSDPSKFTLLDAQQHYNRIHGLEGKGSRQSRFNKKSSLAKFANVTLEEIANNPKKFVDDILKVKGNQQTILQDVRLILSEAKYTLPAGPEGQIHPFMNILPNMAADDALTINFFQGLKSTPDKTYANLAIIDEPENVRSFFMGLDKYAEEYRADTPVVDAIKFGANTGFRPSLITELKKKEIHVFEKGTPNEHYGLIIASNKVGAKDSATKRGGTKKAKTFRVPLNDEASAIIRERMAIAEQMGLGPNDNIFFSGNESSISTKKMNDVLARIEIDGGFIEDLDDPDPDTNIGKVYNTLHIDKKDRPKSGSQLLRNVHTHLATRAGVAPEMIDFLQGRISEQAIHQRLGYLVRHSRASFDPKILNNIKKFTTYYADIGAPQTFYVAGSSGNEQAKIEAEAKRRAELEDTEKRQTIQDQQKGRTTEEGKAKLKNVLMEKYEYSDAEADAVKHRLINVAGLESLEEYVKDKPNLKLDTLEGLDLAMRQRKLDQSSRPVVGPMSQLLAESRQQEAFDHTKDSKLSYDEKGMPIMSDDELAEVEENMRKRGEENLNKRGKIFSNKLIRALPFVGAVTLFAEGQAEGAFRKEDAEDLSISELDESIARESKFYAQAAEEAISPLPVTSSDIEMGREEAAIQRQLMESPEYQQFEREERGAAEARAYDREMGLLESEGLGGVRRRVEEQQRRKSKTLEDTKERIIASRQLRQPRDLVEKYQGFINK